MDSDLSPGVGSEDWQTSGFACGLSDQGDPGEPAKRDKRGRMQSSRCKAASAIYFWRLVSSPILCAPGRWSIQPSRSLHMAIANCELNKFLLRSPVCRRKSPFAVIRPPRPARSVVHRRHSLYLFNILHLCLPANTSNGHRQSIEARNTKHPPKPAHSDNPATGIAVNTRHHVPRGQLCLWQLRPNRRDERCTRRRYCFLASLKCHRPGPSA